MSVSVYNVIASSPLQAIQEHMSKVLCCVNELGIFFEAINDNDWDKAKLAQEHIISLEHDADELKKNIRLKLHKHLFLAIPRPDILDLVNHQDELANRAKDIAGLMMGRQLRPPKVMSEPMLSLLTTSIEACSKADLLVRELQAFFSSAFSGREVDLLDEMIQEIETIESTTDQLQIDVRMKLFHLEKDISPIDAMFLYKITEYLGGLADTAAHIGNRILILLAR